MPIAGAGVGAAAAAAGAAAFFLFPALRRIPRRKYTRCEIICTAVNVKRKFNPLPGVGHPHAEVPPPTPPNCLDQNKGIGGASAATTTAAASASAAAAAREAPANGATTSGCAADAADSGSPDPAPGSTSEGATQALEGVGEVLDETWDTAESPNFAAALQARISRHFWRCIVVSRA